MIKMTVPFENDTGNIVRKLARKSLKSEKRRNLMVVIAVALASCLICFSIVMAYGIHCDPQTGKDCRQYLPD